MKTRVLGVVGATASGKTAASIALAKAVGGEIVCMDSMQVYRGMDIGTAKPTREEMDGVPHHMLDVASPMETFSVTQYADLARVAIDGVAARGNIPILVGGTGLYLRALSTPMDFGYVKSDDAVRARYQAMLDERGAQALHALLTERDPITATRLHPNDSRRVIRALEVLEITGKPFSSQQPREEDAPYHFTLFAIDMPRESLYARVEKRVDHMLADGLVDEVRRLLDGGVRADAQAMQGLGYKELIPYLAGQCALSDATATVKLRTRHYAKRQLTWFRADRRIHWLNADTALHQMLFIAEKDMDHA